MQSRHEAGRQFYQTYNHQFVSEPTGYEGQVAKLLTNIFTEYDIDISSISFNFLHRVEAIGSVRDVIADVAGRASQHIDSDLAIIWLSKHHLEGFGWNRYRHIVAHEAAHIVVNRIHGVKESFDGEPTFERYCKEVGGVVTVRDFDNNPAYLTNILKYL